QFVQACETLIQLRDEGLAKSIGVCKLNAEQLQQLLDQTGVLPVVNQVELQPRFQQAEFRQYHSENDIITEAWSPIARGSLHDDPILKSIAARLERSVAQVILRWHLQLGHMLIPKSVNIERLRENLALFDFQLSAHDMQSIAKLDRP